MTVDNAAPSTEVSLREREARALALLNAQPETMILADRNGNILSINDHGAHRLGASPQALMGQNAYDFLPDDVARRRREYGEQVFRTGEIVRFEDVREGVRFANTLCPVFAADGVTVESVAVYARDITAHSKTADALTKSERRFRSLMEQSPLAIEILTPGGMIAEVNTAWMRLWGFDEEETAQALQQYNMLTDKQTADLGVAPLIRQAFAGEPVVLPPIEYSVSSTMVDIGLPHIEGRSPWIQCHLYPVKDPDGKIAYVVNTYVEITELKQAEKETRVQRDALARVARATSMGQLTGSMAHELNQPLTGILSNAQAAELIIANGECSGRQMQEILSEIVADAKRASDVIRSLRDLYREQKGEFRPVDINAVIHETTQLLHSEFAAQHISPATDCGERIPAVDGNKVQLQQVLVNLIMNAGQAMGEMPPQDRGLRIVTTYDAGSVKAWVEDNGPGIESTSIEGIFEPLATWKPGGTGMGLAISNSIIEAHGGQMWAENRSEGGARVGFTLPVLEGSGTHE